MDLLNYRICLFMFSSQCGDPDCSVDRFVEEFESKRVALCNAKITAHRPHQRFCMAQTRVLVSDKDCLHNHYARFPNFCFWNRLSENRDAKSFEQQTHCFWLWIKCNAPNTCFRKSGAFLGTKNGAPFFLRSFLSQPLRQILDLIIFSWNFRITWSLGWKEKQEDFH